MAVNGRSIRNWRTCAYVFAATVGAKAGRNVSQMHYARQASSPPRWNTLRSETSPRAKRTDEASRAMAGDGCSIPARSGRSDPSIITPEFVRDEVRGQAFIPNNINHPESGSQPIIGRNFL